jgi:DNA-directed RNA polymerase beta subunit
VREYGDQPAAARARTRLAALKEAFQESDLAFRVDVLDWHALSPEFRGVIERAGFEVRDVHYSHYGRICPIETPETLATAM